MSSSQDFIGTWSARRVPFITVRPSISTFHCKTLNNLISPCYPFIWLLAPNPDRRFRPCRKASLSILAALSPLSLASPLLISSKPEGFPIPHPLVFSPPTTVRWSPPTIGLSRLDATLMDLPQVLQTNDLQFWLSPLDATLTKNTGEGVP